MMNKIKNWVKNHKVFTAAGLFIVSICMIAFGIAHFGPQDIPGYGEEPIDPDLGDEEVA